MIQKITAPISVLTLFDHKKHIFTPLYVSWDGEKYKIKKIGYHHKVREGKVLFHIFSVISETLFFRLKFDTESLLWVVEEISDGEVN